MDSVLIQTIKSENANRELIVQQERAMNLERMAGLGLMAAGIAHEINNPLAIILGSTKSVIRGLNQENHSKDQLLRSMEKIESTVGRITKIIRGLRMFSRDGSKDPLETMEFESIIEETLAWCSPKIEQLGIELRVDLDSKKFFVIGHNAQLSQVILNLLNNAIDAIEGQKESWISLKTETLADRVLLTITDSGTGIPEEVAKKIMDPFFTTKAPGKGTGLGLSISFGIMKSHSGGITYDSSSKNTRFVLWLPVARQSLSA